MIITGRTLAEIGPMLHGPEWRAWLGRKLNRSERMIRLYEKDLARMPRKVREALRDVIRERRAALATYEDELP